MNSITLFNLTSQSIYTGSGENTSSCIVSQSKVITSTIQSIGNQIDEICQILCIYIIKT